jgi:hypothetical protein
MRLRREDNGDVLPSEMKRDLFARKGRDGEGTLLPSGSVGVQPPTYRYTYDVFHRAPTHTCIRIRKGRDT